jgi:hypothetical protein
MKLKENLLCSIFIKGQSYELNTKQLLILFIFSVIVIPSFAQGNKFPENLDTVFGGTEFIEISEEAVRKSVNYHMEKYPKSTLKDLYKYFFQDKYGPGHMINDTEVAKNYLLSELNSYVEITEDSAEPIGWEQNFYRVNLSLIKNNLIPFDVFFDAFLESAENIKPYPIEKWKKEWSILERVIQSMSFSLPDYEKDSREIQERLNEGKYVGHHSEIFNKTYNPHYRIISKKVFIENLLPLLESENK